MGERKSGPRQHVEPAGTYSLLPVAQPNMAPAPLTTSKIVGGEPSSPSVEPIAFLGGRG